MRLSKPEIAAVFAKPDLSAGSDHCFRSDVGSRLAADLAVGTLREFAESVAAASPTEVKKLAEQRLPKILVQKWCAAVQEHVAANPFDEAEKTKLRPLPKASASNGGAANGAGALRDLMPYGATLVAVLLTSEYIVCLQLGDGEILTVSEKTSRVEAPMPADESLIANETTSLCQEDAWKRFRFRFQFFVESPPALVLLTTDGYPNSFQTTQGFRQVASDLLNVLDRDGVKDVEDKLPHWLETASKGGSGDDVTVGIVYCEPTAPRPVFVEPEQPAVQEAAPAVEHSPSLVPPPSNAWVATSLTMVQGLLRLFRQHPGLGVGFAAVALVLAVYSGVLSVLHFRPPLEHNSGPIGVNSIPAEVEPAKEPQPAQLQPNQRIEVETANVKPQPITHSPISKPATSDPAPDSLPEARKQPASPDSDPADLVDPTDLNSPQPAKPKPGEPNPIDLNLDELKPVEPKPAEPKAVEVPAPVDARPTPPDGKPPIPAPEPKKPDADQSSAPTPDDP